jgi:hypothetical protein
MKLPLIDIADIATMGSLCYICSFLSTIKTSSAEKRIKSFTNNICPDNNYITTQSMEKFLEWIKDSDCVVYNDIHSLDGLSK